MSADSEPIRPLVRPAKSEISFANRWDHFLARWGVNRSGHRVEPGLYALGNPTGDSPVFVTANYTLSFDALRSALAGIDGFVMVLDTRGINVWCAAGAGTFSTDEVVRRVEATALHEVVRHRVLILPQLSSSGVAAHEVGNRSGFGVEYGPVRAADLPEYLKTRQGTPEMRRVRFTLLDRVVLIPVELVHVLLPMLIAAVAVYFAVSPRASVAAVCAFLAGTVLFPIMLPWLPTRQFSTKGFILGGFVALPFVLAVLPDAREAAIWWRPTASAAAYALTMSPVTAYLALNFTGSTPFTSRTGVRREIFAYVPIMAYLLGVGVALMVVLGLISGMGR